MDESRRRRVALVVIASVVAVTCVGLGIWQLQRLDERRALNRLIRERRAESPLLIEVQVDPHPAPYQAAVAEGAYDVSHEVLVYGRSLNGEPGHLIVTPLDLFSEGAVLVVRGWVPFRFDAAPVAPAGPPLEDVRVRGWLVPDEDGSGPPDADRIVRNIDVEAIASELPYPVFPLPLQLAAQSPPQPGSLPVPVPLPKLTDGPHLSYAIQWFSFGAIALVGAVVLLHRERPRPTGGP
jgi:surfeit locus 1 family protein